MNKDIDFWQGRTPFNPFRDRFNLHSSRVFDDFMNPWWERNLSSDNNGFDLEETESYYLMTLDLPGVSKDNININVSGNRVHVSAERRNEAPEGERKNRFSRSYGRFEQTFVLPIDIDSEKVEANYRNGVLELAIPKSETSKTRKVSVSEHEGLISRYLHKAQKGIRELSEGISSKLKEDRPQSKKNEDKAA